LSFSVQTASLLRSDDVAGPVTAGFWRPVLLLPATFIDARSPTEFLAAIGHECAHIQRNDFWKNVCYEAVALVTAFHPVTWFIKSHIAQTREMVCDRMAAEQLLDRRAYGKSLLQLAARMPPEAPSAAFHALGMFHTDILERRVMTVMTALPRVSRVRRYLLGVSATLLLCLCAGGSAWFTQPVAAQTSKSSAPADSRGKNQQAGKDLSCTYYDDKDVGSSGTCGVDKQDKNKYRCYSDQDRSKSQPQIGCEWKVRRAAEAKK
jgi:beta-lactamase regulating signal transducer with metallopeptidase domain